VPKISITHLTHATTASPISANTTQPPLVLINRAFFCCRSWWILLPMNECNTKTNGFQQIFCLCMKGVGQGVDFAETILGKIRKVTLRLVLGVVRVYPTV
jgi:hypothetical protein